MFAVNGPSGPTQRFERQKKSKEIVHDDKTEADHVAAFFTKKTNVKKLETKDMQKPDDASHRSAGLQDNSNRRKSSIFKGCRIIFNGRTGNISAYNLAKLVESHGGTVCTPLSSVKPTHMIAMNLNGSKAEKALQKKSRFHIVHSNWITESIQHQQKQPVYSYLLYRDPSTHPIQ